MMNVNYKYWHDFGRELFRFVGQSFLHLSGELFVLANLVSSLIGVIISAFFPVLQQ